MQEQDPYILAAMQGNDRITRNTASNVPSSEPTAMFFVIFGLVYEALATASPDSENSGLARNLPVVALKCLKCLVVPAYSGDALFEPSTFDELMSLFYRMAITESALVRIHLVETIASMAIRQDRKLVEPNVLVT
jgi:HEAT repeat-containing protein 5